MWRFKPFSGKEPSGLEGRTVDVGNVKITVRNAIAEGGFSCVYIAHDVMHPSKQYALKHMICNDRETLDLVMKEIQVMKLLKGHPNVVTPVAHTILDMGRTKEALLVMEFCEKSLVSVLDSRGTGYFEEKQILLIFRDICNAVFAMHGQSPPIAHRDLKVENVLLGSDGAWKLCDFGSTTTNHKCFDRPEEMGVEEDNIRKHTTPAYRAPEMWDLYRKEVISEKVDIWALGCLLYRLCYLKSAFDGESKLQILNGNYKIPELPKYSTSIVQLIRDMLEGSPNNRPDITQVWFRVNGELPMELQKDLPDGAPSNTGLHPPALNLPDEGPKRTPLMPRRSPPPPPSSREQVRNISPSTEKATQHSRSSPGMSKAAEAPLGVFWSTQHAQDSQAAETNKPPLFDEEPIKPSFNQNQNILDTRSSPPAERPVRSGQSVGKSVRTNFRSNDGASEDFEIRFFPDLQHGSHKTKLSHPESKPTFKNEASNNFVGEFDSNNGNVSRIKELELELDNLKEQLKKANLEKAEITSKYEKLSAICRSQRQEIQELKHAIAATPSPPNKDGSKRDSSPGNSQELQHGIFAGGSPSCSFGTEPERWQAFSNEKAQTASINGQQNSTKQTTAAPSNDVWGFGLENFRATPTPSVAHISASKTHGSSSQRFGSGVARKVEQPSGWTGF
ncbi:probable serine/threonine-protein kinase DDB_G0276461 isoform X2 [Ananas comosus]|uniref:non-specific serine/threonine protein kinase n=1 Tax=Ananas comosus TaxID=4615 RepID=A0A6P5GQI7_ANACO|nr:probable serine/threonine-protein kinase DDB_G0276461 isoform X2 [Ananas comosus]